MATKTAITRARDIMRKDVLSLPSGTSIQDAVETLEEYGITGAPVINAAGVPIGFFSRSDVARGEHLRRGRIEGEQNERVMAEAFDEALDSFDAEELEHSAFYAREDYSGEVTGRTTVDDWMRPEVIAVAPDESVRDLCRRMLERSIHRVLVVDAGKVQGIVTSMDVVRLVAGR